MIAHPMAVTVALCSHIINATLQVLSTNKSDEGHNRSTEQTHNSEPGARQLRWPVSDN